MIHMGYSIAMALGLASIGMGIRVERENDTRLYGIQGYLSFSPSVLVVHTNTTFGLQHHGLVCSQPTSPKVVQFLIPVELQRLALSSDSRIIDILRRFVRTPPVCGSWYYHALRSQFGSFMLSAQEDPLLSHMVNSPCTKGPSTLLPVCSSGCPTTICKNLCRPSLLCSITSSLKRFVNTLPGRGGIVTLALSRSRMSRKYSKSLYRRRTTLWRSLKAGMLVRVWIS